MIFLKYFLIIFMLHFFGIDPKVKNINITTKFFEFIYYVNNMCITDVWAVFFNILVSQNNKRKSLCIMDYSFTTFPLLSSIIFLISTINLDCSFISSISKFLWLVVRTTQSAFAKASADKSTEENPLPSFVFI